MTASPQFTPVRPARSYQVEISYENYETGERFTRLLPKPYKTFVGAEKCAQRHRWTTMPDANTRIDVMRAKVLEVAEAAQ